MKRICLEKINPLHLNCLIKLLFTGIIRGVTDTVNYVQMEDATKEFDLKELDYCTKSL